MNGQTSLFFTLAEARAKFEKELADGEQHHCPCCDRSAKRYKRAIHKGMARALIALCRAGGEFNFIHYSYFTSIKDGGDFSKLAWWGMIEAEENTEEHKRTSGFWRITHIDMDFLKGIPAPKYIVTYEGKVVERLKEVCTIEDALGEAFNFSEIIKSW